MIIRKIEKKDDAQVAYIIRTCLTEYGGDHRTDTAWADPYLDHFSEYYIHENMAYWVAEDNGTVVAGVGIGPLSADCTICELQKMYCLKDYRGTGIAHELLKTALHFAKQYYSGCYLETLDNMTRAQKFYEKHGFVRTDKTYGNTGHNGCNAHYLIEWQKC
ncbi:MAG: GNAT family N-acetyltransferase [Erysipelotrichaceae bacterium]|nr:GNAT family N-acetyltransferase [Erysipelotrichaceae bacterium]